MGGYKHYIRTNAAGVIMLGFTSAFPEIATPQVGDILIAEDGPRHFQQAWQDLVNERGQFRYRWQNGFIERSQAEIDAEEAALPLPPPPPEERIAELEATVADLTQLLAEKGITP